MPVTYRPESNRSMQPTLEYLQLAGGQGAPSKVNDSLSSVHMEISTTTVASISLVVFAVLGFAGNLGLLMSARCKKSICTLQYALPLSLAIANIIFCLVWVPFEVTRLIMNYHDQGLHAAICYLNVTLFTMCMVTIVFHVFFIAIQKICNLCERPDSCLNGLVVTGITASWACGVLTTVYRDVEFSWTADYHICINTPGVFPETALPIAAMLMAVVSLFILVIVLVFLTITTLLKKYYIQQEKRVFYRRQRSGSLNSGQDISPDEGFGEARPSHCIPNDPKDNTSAEGGISHKLLYVQTPENPEKDKNDDASESSEGSNADSFDIKMRLKLAGALSGRRHTVANIGGSPMGARRGSFGTPGSKSSSGPKYNYVRKWSVDIVALQDQLENPKAHGGNYPFRELQLLKEKDKEKEQNNHKEKETKDKPPNTPKVTFDSLEPKVIETTLDNPPETPESPTVPAITVNSNNNDDAASNTSGGIESEEDVFWKKARKVAKQTMRSAAMCIILVTLALVSVLPFMLIQLLYSSMDLHLNRNLSAVLASVCLIQIVFQPIVLACMERKLWQAMKRLHMRLTHWRCVCYCNLVPKQRKHPKYKEDATQV